MAIPMLLSLFFLSHFPPCSLRVRVFVCLCVCVFARTCVCVFVCLRAAILLGGGMLQICEWPTNLFLRICSRRAVVHRDVLCYACHPISNSHLCHTLMCLLQLFFSALRSVLLPRICQLPRWMRFLSTLWPSLQGILERRASSGSVEWLVSKSELT